MATLCYFQTSFSEALGYGNSTLVFDFTPFGRAADAIAAVGSNISVDPPMIGKLELPDETIELPSQAELGYLSQLGYDPVTPDDMRKEFRLAFRREGLQRVSVVPWDKMQDDISEKVSTAAEIPRASEEMRLYLQDHGDSFDAIVNDDDARDEALDVGMKAANLLRDYDLQRKAYGFTSVDEDLLLKHQNKVMGFFNRYYESRLKYFLRLLKSEVASASREEYLGEAIHSCGVLILLNEQKQSGLVKLMQKEGRARDYQLVHVGEEELSSLPAGDIDIDRLAQAALRSRDSGLADLADLSLLGAGSDGLRSLLVDDIDLDDLARIALELRRLEG